MRVVIETPLAKDPKDASAYMRYSKACLYDSLVSRGEVPFCAQLFLGEWSLSQEAVRGISEEWSEVSVHVYYCNLGITKEMQDAIDRDIHFNRKYEKRVLAEDWDSV